MLLLHFTLLALGCADGGPPAGDSSDSSDSGDSGVVTVTVTCTFDYVTDTGHETGDYPGYETDCDTWAESGFQAMISRQGACEQAGIDAGADSATCTCEVDTGTCTFPNDVND